MINRAWKKSILSLSFLLGLSAAFAQEYADSIPADSAGVYILHDVYVEARTQKVIKDGVEYIPAKKTKKTSLDATSLLLNMQIPQLSIDPTTMKVKTVTGKDVAMYVDYVPASAELIAGLRPEDVMKVEILDYPQDPRFGGAEHAVNFIMHKYEWGGYTKLSATGQTMNINSADGYAFSRFVYKKWTFDAYGGGGFSHIDRYISSADATFRDVELDERHYAEIKRSSQVGDDYLGRRNKQAASFCASYRNGKTYIQHALAFGRDYIPTNRYGSVLAFSDEAIGQTTSKRQSTQLQLYPTVMGYYQLGLPSNSMIVAAWNFSYTASRRNSSYQLSDFSPIINNNREHSYAPNAQLQYYKQLRHNNAIIAQLMSYNSVFDTRYWGSDNTRQKLFSSEDIFLFIYTQRWKRLSLYSRVGLSYVIGRVNDKTTLSEWNPRLGLQLAYQFNQKHSLSLEGWWANSHPQASTANSALVQENELMWLQGNPDLRNTLFTQATIGYTYIPSNKLSISINAEYQGNPHKLAYRFYSVDGRDGLIRQYINSGTSNRYSAWASATLRLFANTLAIGANAQMDRVVFTGIDARTINAPFATISAQFAKNNFSAMLFYQSPRKAMSETGYGFRSQSDCSYGLNINYALGGFKASLKFYNWFARNGFTRLYYDSPRYSEYVHDYDRSLSRSIALSVTYTFRYGKKISTSDEKQGGASAQSAILK